MFKMCISGIDHERAISRLAVFLNASAVGSNLTQKSSFNWNNDSSNDQLLEFTSANTNINAGGNKGETDLRAFESHTLRTIKSKASPVGDGQLVSKSFSLDSIPEPKGRKEFRKAILHIEGLPDQSIGLDRYSVEEERLPPATVAARDKLPQAVCNTQARAPPLRNTQNTFNAQEAQKKISSKHLYLPHRISFDGDLVAMGTNSSISNGRYSSTTFNSMTAMLSTAKNAWSYSSGGNGNEGRVLQAPYTKKTRNKQSWVNGNSGQTCSEDSIMTNDKNNQGAFYRYCDPLVGATNIFQQRVAELAGLQVDTVRRERAKASKSNNNAMLTKKRTKKAQDQSTF